jgi:hypothetical protein
VQQEEKQGKRRKKMKKLGSEKGNVDKETKNGEAIDNT